MTKQEQIEEMAKFISNYADKHDWELHEPELEDLAIELYNAGYRKIDDLKAENKQLKTECALLDDELRGARQEIINVLNELKSKCHNYYPSIDHYCCSIKAVNLSDINEFIKEQLKK